jgi:hypothetical protein
LNQAAESAILICGILCSTAVLSDNQLNAAAMAGLLT